MTSYAYRMTKHNQIMRHEMAKEPTKNTISGVASTASYKLSCTSLQSHTTSCVTSAVTSHSASAILTFPSPSVKPEDHLQVSVTVEVDTLKVLDALKFLDKTHLFILLIATEKNARYAVLVQYLTLLKGDVLQGFVASDELDLKSAEDPDIDLDNQDGRRDDGDEFENNYKKDSDDKESIQAAAALRAVYGAAPEVAALETAHEAALEAAYGAAHNLARDVAWSASLC
ncbi:hypothetical protein BKA93DRAFT_754184 [Sparassis latifolia]